MLIVRNVNNLRQQLAPMRDNRSRLTSLVITRGDLHDGHVAVINAAGTVSDIVVVAFIPAEFAHPRNIVTPTEFSDVGTLERHHVDVLFAPAFDDFFPNGHEDICAVQPISTEPSLGVPPLFLTLQLKLINAVRPNVLVCGDKNYVEFFHTRRMLQDLNLDTQIHCVPTVRHANGTPVTRATEDLEFDERERLAILYTTLRDVAHAIRDGARSYAKLENTARVALKGAALAVDYFAVLDGDTLQPAAEHTTTYRIIGRVRR